MQETEVLETPYMRLHKENGILVCVFANDLFIDLDIAKDCVRKRIAFSKGVSYPFLVDMRGVKGAEKDAKEYLGSEGSVLVKAGALYVSSALTRLLGNLFIQVNKPVSPTRLFTSREEALHWLQEFL